MARELGNAGVEAYQAGDFSLAVEKLDKAYQILRAPSLGLWSARAFVKVGRLLDGSERYLEVTRLQPTGGDLVVQEQAKADAARELESLGPRIPKVVIEIEGAEPANVTLTFNGHPLAVAALGEKRPVNVGKHVIEGRHRGEIARADVAVGEAETVKAVLKFTGVVGPVAALPGNAPRENGRRERPQGSGNSMRTLGWIGIGAGALGVGVGGVTGLLALGKRNDIDENPNCLEGVCERSEKGDVDGLNSLRTISTVSFVAGGVLAAAGVALVITSSSPEQASTSIWIGPNGGAVRGRF